MEKHKEIQPMIRRKRWKLIPIGAEMHIEARSEFQRISKMNIKGGSGQELKKFFGTPHDSEVPVRNVSHWENECDIYHCFLDSSESDATSMAMVEIWSIWQIHFAE